MNNIFIANAKGDLMILNIFDQQVECVGCIIDGIAAVDWSPDQELLVIISGFYFFKHQYLICNGILIRFNTFKRN